MPGDPRTASLIVERTYTPNRTAGLAAFRRLLGLPPGRGNFTSERRPHVCDAGGGVRMPATELPASAIVSHAAAAGEQETAP